MHPPNYDLVIAGALGLLAACGPQRRNEMAAGDAPPDVVDAAPLCPPPPNPAGPEAQLAAPYAAYYSAFDLGVPSGIPDPLGGTTILAMDPDTLLIAGASERAQGTIYRIGVTRDMCHHIIGFAGTASPVATTPYVDANLVFANHTLLLYTEWPQFKLAQLAGAATTPSSETDLRTLGMPSTGDSGPGGIGFVPPGLPAKGELRIVTWPAGHWYHVATSPSGNVLAINSIANTVTLANNPGGFAYVPAGSPAFTQQAVIVAEWSQTDATKDRVAVYDADGNGDPVVATRREFFSKFPRPWGAYFEPLTGDYLFLSWGSGVDHVYIVQGFVPPVIL